MFLYFLWFYNIGCNLYYVGKIYIKNPYGYFMEDLKCSLCGKLLLFDKKYKMVIYNNGKEETYYLCERCYNLIKREKFVVYKEFKLKNKSAKEIVIQKHLSRKSFPIPPEEIEYVVFIFVKKED